MPEHLAGEYTREYLKMHEGRPVYKRNDASNSIYLHFKLVANALFICNNKSFYNEYLWFLVLFYCLVNINVKSMSCSHLISHIGRIE